MGGRDGSRSFLEKGGGRPRKRGLYVSKGKNEDGVLTIHWGEKRVCPGNRMPVSVLRTTGKKS